MTTNQAPQVKSEALTDANKTIRNWLVVFCLSAALSAMSAMVGPQNVIVTGVMIVSAAVLAWKLYKREFHLEPVPAAANNNVIYMAERR